MPNKYSYIQFYVEENKEYKEKELEFSFSEEKLLSSNIENDKKESKIFENIRTYRIAEEFNISHSIMNKWSNKYGRERIILSYLYTKKMNTKNPGGYMNKVITSDIELDKFKEMLEKELKIKERKEKELQLKKEADIKRMLEKEKILKHREKVNKYMLMMKEKGIYQEYSNKAVEEFISKGGDKNWFFPPLRESNMMEMYIDENGELEEDLFEMNVEIVQLEDDVFS